MTETLARSGIALALAVAVLFVALRTPLRAHVLRAFDWLAGLSRARALLLIVVIALGARFALIPAFEPRDHADVKEYVEKAAQIADHGTPREQEVRQQGWHFYRTLGWSLPLGGWYKLTGTRSLLSARVFCALLSGLVAVLIVFLGGLAVSERVGRAAGLAYAVFLPHVQFAVVPYSETWATFLMVASALAFEQLRRGEQSTGRRLAWSLGLGLSVGCLLITRAEFLWLPALVCALLLWRHRRQMLPWVAASALILIGCAVPVIVNHTIRSGYPGWMRTSSQGGLILYFGNNPIHVNGHGNATPEVSAKVRAMYAEDPTGGSTRQAALDWMKRHPGQVLANMPLKAVYLWIATPQGFGWLAQTGEPQGLHRGLAAVLRWTAHIQALGLLVLGVLAFWKTYRPAYALWIVLILLHLGMWSLLAASPRNKYPLEPFLLIAAAAWVLRSPQTDDPNRVTSRA